MRRVIYLLISLVIGYGLTLIFYVAGGSLVQPALFLAKFVVSDRGGDSLLLPFTVINTFLCSIFIYAGLWWATRTLSSPRN
jgi:hypothetical protein